MKEIYTKEAFQSYFIVFKCNKCEEIVPSIQVLRESRSYSNGISLFDTIEERETKADKELTRWKREVVGKLKEDVKNKKMHHLNAHCKCPKCNNVPFWSSGKFDSIFTYLGVLLVLPSFLITVLAVSFAAIEGNFSLFPWAGLVWSMLWLILLISHIYTKIKIKKAITLGEEYLPIVCSNEKEMNEACAKLKSSQRTTSNTNL